MRLPTLLCCSLFATPALAGEIELVLDGPVPEGGLDHFFVPFDVPEGTVEIEVQHDDLSDDNILDWGLDDPSGFRGWGGGNAEPAIVGLTAASRSYLAGPIAAGQWRVVVGKAKLAQTPAGFALTVILRDTPTLAAQPDRGPYAPFAGLGGGPRWYAGDLHVHSRESGDAKPPLADIAALARSRGLDFVEISDHNTTSQLDFFAAAQAAEPDVLFVPGAEFTTYAGHANAIGATLWVDHKIGQPGVTIAAAATAYASQGALLSINHPALDLGDVCIGCAWKHEVPAGLAAVEVAPGGLAKAGKYFTDDAIAFWDMLCGEGHHLAAIGGSDDHRAGVDLGSFDSPIGDPTTMIYADELSTPALLAGIAAGRTVVKLQGPGDPMVEMTSDNVEVGDTITVGYPIQLLATVSGAPGGSSVRFVRNGKPMPPIPVTDDPFVAVVEATPPADGEDRWRAEVLVDGKPRTITSHLWLRDDPGATPTTGPEPTTSTGSTGEPGAPATSTGEPVTSSTGAPGEAPTGPTGCACDLEASARPVGAATLLLLLARRRRR